MTVDSPRTPCGGTPVPPSAIHSGDWIRVEDEGHEITARAIGVTHNPDHEPGSADVEWEQVYPYLGNLLLHHDHTEFSPAQTVVRVWAGPVPGAAA